MNNDVLRVPLREIMTPVCRPEGVVPNKSYRILGCHWYAHGLYVKDIKDGTQIQASQVFQVKQGDFVYNRLFAWKGSFAVATDEDNDCYVSNEFPCFIVDRERVNAQYLWRYFSRSTAWSEALGLSSGSTPTSRNRLKEEEFLAMRVPLPPLDEQRRIVACIEELAGKIEEARGLRQAVEQESTGILQSIYSEITEGVERQPMSEVAPLVRRPVQVDLSQNYHELGIRSFGKGTFHKPAISGVDLGSKRIFEIEPGDVVFNIVFAWEGAVAVAMPEDQGRVGSHRFLTCVPEDGVLTSSFLSFHFLTQQGLEQLGTASPGGAGRNRTLGLKALEAIRVPVPPIEKQVWFNSIYDKVSMIKHVHAETQPELDALLPSILDKAFEGEL